MKNRFYLNLAQAINKFLALDSKNSLLLPKLIGTCFEIEITDIQQNIFLSFSEAGVSIMDAKSVQVPDVIISGRMVNLLGAGIKSEYNNIKILGDKRKAKLLVNILSELDLPIDELAKNAFGDKTAYWADSVVQKTNSLIKQLYNSSVDNLSSYISEEKAITVTYEEFNEFKIRIKKCRDKLARLEKCV